MRKNLALFAIIALCYHTALKAQTFNSYFGNIHSQTSYSDGNKDSSTSGLTTPLQAFTYANASQQIDFYGISDHNHLNAGMTSPSHFHMGIADANTANNDGSFVALYGQEWGVISGGGHAIIYGYDSLMGWDSGDYDVFVAQNNYTGLWNKVNAKAGAFAYLAHPQSTDYSNFFSAYTASADNAVVGMAARSGPAFSTNNTYSDPSTSDFTARYQDALARGYHLGIGLDHDSHNSVFGRQTAGRLVVVAAGLTRFNILDGIKKMRMYSSDDWNTRVNFNIGNQPMGSIYAHAGTPTINVTVSDPDGEATASIKIYYGIPGSGSVATILTSNTGSNTLLYNHVIANATTYYYYAEITQADGDVIWTSPIWYTRNNTITANAPVTSFTFAGNSYCVGQQIPLSDLSTNTPTGWQWTFIGASVNTSALQNPSVTYTAAGIYSITLVATNTVGTGVPFTKTISIGGTAPVLSVNGSASVCAGSSVALTATGATNYTWSTGANTNSITVTPTATSVYTVTGSNGGCTSSITKNITVGASPTVNISGINPICGGGSSTLTATGTISYSWNTGATTASIIVSPTINTSYTVTGTASNGCKNKTVTTVSVGPSPTITISGQTSLCAGSTTTLTSTGAVSYTWNNGSNAASVVLSPTTNTTYTVTGTNSSGCKNSKTATILVNSLPVISIAGSNTTCSGASIILTGSGATSYTWSTGANTTTISASPTVNTTYTLTGTNSNGCRNSTTKTITVNSIIIAANGGAVCPGNSFTINPTGAATYTYSGGSQIVSPSSTTSYTVYGTSAQGCSAQPAVLTVTVSPTLSVSISGSNSVCTGNSIVLTANGAASYTWNTGATSNAISVAPATNVTYSVYGSGGSGCSGTSVKSITVMALPSVSASSSSNLICAGQSASLTASGAASYTWSNANTTPIIVVSPSVTTSYTVTGKNINGCIASVIITQSVSTCTGINNNTSEKPAVQLFPNPTKGNFTILSDQNGYIMIYNLAGQLVFEKKLESGSSFFTLEKESSGLYFIRITLPTGTVTKRLIKE